MSNDKSRGFVHLHVHSDFSLLDGAIRIPALAQRAAEWKMPAVALTDHGNLFGAISFYDAMTSVGVKPIIGIEAYWTRGSRFDKGSIGGKDPGKAINHIIILAKDETGYRNLVKLSSFSYLEGFHYKPRIDKELLSTYRAGLVALSSCASGVPTALLLQGRFDEAAREALELQEILGKGNYFLEIQDHGIAGQKEAVSALVELSKRTGIPLVATNDCHYLDKEDYKAHDVLLCIGTGKTVKDTNRLRYDSDQLYFKSAEEMWALFGDELPEALEATLTIAEMCHLRLPKAPGVGYLPLFPVPEGETLESYFERVTRVGFEERWQSIQSQPDRKYTYEQYRARLDHEIEVIKQMGFAGYFLIVWDLIRYAREKEIPVGPGRGCLAGDVPIVMADGTTKPIREVRAGDSVRTHTGRTAPVTAHHRYMVDEPLVRLRCYYGDSVGVTLTRDHKVLAERGCPPESWERWAASTKAARRRWREPTGQLQWIAAGQLQPGDWVFVPTPQVEVAPLAAIDLAAVADPAWARVGEDYIEETCPTNQAFPYSLHDVSRRTGISRNSVQFIARGVPPRKANPRHERAKALVTSSGARSFGDLAAWRAWVGEQAQVMMRLARLIQPDRRFFRVLGRWIANGWMNADRQHVLGLAFHSDDHAGLAEAVDFFHSLGLTPHIERATNGQKLTQLIVRSRVLTNYWRSIFPHYCSTPETKHIPEFVLRLPVDHVLDVLAGYWLGDGTVGQNQQSRYVATTVSHMLADQLRFLAWRCGIPASVRRDERHDERFNVQPSFIITLAQDERLAVRLGAPARAAQYVWREVPGGLLLRLREVVEVHGIKEVFDLTVEEDHTYQTSSFAVHNSAAGSLVAYSLKITDIDPLQYELLFERFLNPERVTLPDIDIDFCVRGRQEVINYVSELYGRENVSQIITFGTLASRAVIKDVGRALEMKYSEVEKVAAMIPPPIRGRNVSIEEAIRRNPELKRAIETNPQVAELIDLAKRLEGCARHASIHAAGIVISPQPLHDLIPIYKTPKDEITTQFALTDLEKTGILKMDFLALTTLTIINDCVKMIEEETGEKVDLSKIPLDDKLTLQLFAEGNTDAIFQFEGEGVRDLCRRLKPEKLEDLVALNALYRPGPIDSGMVDEFIERRHGRRQVKYDFPELKEVIGNTFGICIYQEQIMALFQRLADYSLGEADLVRRAMGKKKRQELDKHRERFLQRAAAKGYDRAKLEKLWASIEGFADYAFNRSHAVAYGWLAYQTAYLKAHYPTHFYAAVMSNELGNTDKVVKYINQARARGIEILPPDVNTSREGFTPRGGKIRFGLAAIKGIGLATVQAIIAARQAGGPFRSIFDFAARVDQRVLNKRVLESLIKAGAFDSLGVRRRQLFAVIDQAIDFGARRERERRVGQFGLFASPVDSMANGLEPALPPLPEWPTEERLAGEKETLGFYVTGHPLDKYVKEIAAYTDATTETLLSLRESRSEEAEVNGEMPDAREEMPDEPYPASRLAHPASRIPHPASRVITIAGVVTSIALKTTKKGDRFAIFTLEDQFGSLRVIVWPDVYAKVNGLLKDDAMIVVKGRLEIAENAATLVAEEVITLDSLQERMTQTVIIRVKAESLTPAKVDLLYGILDRHRGSADVLFEVECAGGALARIKPNPFVKIKPSPEAIADIKRLCADCDVLLVDRDR